MNKITKNLKELNDLEYPGAGNDNKWNLYWNHFRKFTESYGTHMVTKVYYGARVIRIVTEETAEKVDINEWKVETDIKVDAVPKIDLKDGNNGNLKVDKSYSKTKRGSQKKTEWCLKGIKPTDGEIEWDKIETGLKNLDSTDRNTIIEEELTPIWLILEHHPDVQNYLSAIKNLANYIQGYSNDMPCKCSDVTHGEKGQCKKFKGGNYCYVKEINQWPGEENAFLPQVNKGQFLNGCSPTTFTGAKTYPYKGDVYRLADDPCKPRNQPGHKCYDHSMCEDQYYCTDDEDKDHTCQPRKNHGGYCGLDDRKCAEGYKCESWFTKGGFKHCSRDD